MTRSDESAAPTVRLPMDLTIEQARPLHAELVAAFAAPHPVRLDGSAVDRADAAGVQLLAAALRTATATGRSAFLHAPSEALRLAIRTLGLDDLPGLAPDAPQEP